MRDDDGQALDNALGGRLRRAREEADLSLAEVAKRSGLSESVIGKIERGRRDPRIGTLVRIVAAVGIAIEDLLAGVYGEGEPFAWDRLASRVLHPIQVVILESLIRIEHPVSPVDVVGICEGRYALALVGYHVRALADRGLIEEVDTEPVRGTIRHIYALVPESRWP